MLAYLYSLLPRRSNPFFIAYCDDGLDWTGYPCD